MPWNPIIIWSTINKSAQTLDGNYGSFQHQLTMEGSIMDFIEVLSDFREVELPVGLLVFLSSL